MKIQPGKSMKPTVVPLESNEIYHVYNHANAGDVLFREEDNYLYFLKRLKKYLIPVIEVYAYCLLPNHFHLLIKTKGEEDVENFANDWPSKKDKGDADRVDSIISNQFRKFLISYSKAYNKRYNRRGSLFEENLKRKVVDSDEYLTTMVRYIHFNPVLHGFVNRPVRWRFNSIHAYYSAGETSINRSDVIEWFGGLESFKSFHESIQNEEIEKIRSLSFE